MEGSALIVLCACLHVADSKTCDDRGKSKPSGSCAWRLTQYEPQSTIHDRFLEGLLDGVARWT